MASTLIKNGLVYDGLGNAPKKADIYIKDDRIERIGETICREADLVVDAAGRADSLTYTATVMPSHLTARILGMSC